MTDSPPVTGSGTIPFPLPAELANHRLQRLRARIEGGNYPLHPILVAEAILACDEQGPCGDARVIGLTLAGGAPSNR